MTDGQKQRPNERIATMPQPGITDELKRMLTDYEPLSSTERKLIWYTFATGVLLLALFILLTRTVS